MFGTIHATEECRILKEESNLFQRVRTSKYLWLETAFILRPPTGLNVFGKFPGRVIGQAAAPRRRLHPKPVQKSAHRLRRHSVGRNPHANFVVVGFNGDHGNNIFLSNIKSKCASSRSIAVRCLEMLKQRLNAGGGRKNQTCFVRCKKSMTFCRLQIYFIWTFHNDGVKLVLKDNDSFAIELNILRCGCLAG